MRRRLQDKERRRNPELGYLTLIVPENSPGQTLPTRLVDVIRYYCDETTVNIICADGCPVNTGRENGAIHLCELELNIPLHWATCLVHCVELLLKNYMAYIDGRTIRDKGYHGNLGKSLVVVKTDMAVVSFNKISGMLDKFPETVTSSFRSDQRYLYYACHSIMNGTEPPKTHFGNYRHARWSNSCRHNPTIVCCFNEANC